MRNNTQKISTFQKPFFVICIILFLLSLFQPAFYFKDFDGSKVYKGWEVLLFGGIAILGGGLMEWIVWLANPLLILSGLLLSEGHKWAKYFSITAFVLSCSFMLWQEILAAENGRMAPITSRGIGYFFWLSSMGIWTFSFFGQDMKGHSSKVENKG